MTSPVVIIIAGPNGAGKTTFAHEFLPNEASCPVFINADLIAAGLSPFHPESSAIRAGRLMLEEIARYTKAKTNFAFETTLSGTGYTRRIHEWQGLGYKVSLIYLRLAHVEEAISRVAERVAQGGHHVPTTVIQRRFAKSWQNFEFLYKPIVDKWVLYDATPYLRTIVDYGGKYE